MRPPGKAIRVIRREMPKLSRLKSERPVALLDPNGLTFAELAFENIEAVRIVDQPLYRFKLHRESSARPSLARRAGERLFSISAAAVTRFCAGKSHYFLSITMNQARSFRRPHSKVCPSFCSTMPMRSTAWTLSDRIRSPRAIRIISGLSYGRVSR